ncbi:hypothetical protein RvY_15483 [Ramazzottius varieornatus]|uniref:Uncharacterized protein n=1 Tax=Ramazzottius varieornatus TaxID=947166 RepID=A0A1D1VV23_RAMVA|nr:hypothetical protein RvY_15483 [Ramazzottius varieornatus]
MEAMKKVQLGFLYDGKPHVFVPTQYHKTLLDGGKVFEDTCKHLRQGKVTLVYKGNYGRVKDADDMELGTAHGVVNDVLSEILTGDDCGNMMLRIEDGFFR